MLIVDFDNKIVEPNEIIKVNAIIQNKSKHVIDSFQKCLFMYRIIGTI